MVDRPGVERRLRDPLANRERSRTRFESEVTAPAEPLAATETDGRAAVETALFGEPTAPPERVDFGGDFPGDDDGPRLPRFRVAEEEFETGFADADELEDLL